MSAAGAAQDPQANGVAYRDIVGRFASGVTIVTSMDERGPSGFTCQTFHSVSLDPPLVSFSVMKSSMTYPRIRETGRFTVNVLAGGQRAISDQFARTGNDKWVGIHWSKTEMGNPALDGALAWLDCEIWAEHEAGDHHIVLGRVLGSSASGAQNKEPLVYFRSKYRHLLPEGADNEG